MTRRPHPIDERFEHLLREQDSSTASDAMSGLVRDLRRAYVAPFPMEVQNRQVEELIMAGREAAPSRPSPFRRQVNGVWYRFSQRFIATSVVGKVVLAASVAAAATTGFATTGRLPDPMQIAFSAAAAQIGVSLPTPATEVVQAGPSPEASTSGRTAPARILASASPQPPRPAQPGGAQVQPSPSAAPADACDQATPNTPSAAGSPSPSDDVQEALRNLTEEQLQLDELLRCLTPPEAPPPNSGEEGASSGSLEDLLEELLGAGG